MTKDFNMEEESMDCRQYFNEIIKDKQSQILEIGPLNRPLADKSIFPNTTYCDIRTTEQIKSLYTSSEYLETTGIRVPVETIVDLSNELVMMIANNSIP